jgi:hypothetical protein
MIRQVLKSRTVWLAILTAVLSVLQGFVFKLPVTPMEQAVIGSVLAALIVILRAVTTVPLSEK